MEKLAFDGQQTGEKILYTIYTAPLVITIANARIVAVVIFVLIISAVLGSGGYQTATTMGILGSVGILALGLWWNKESYGASRTYITDRRIIRFERVSPFVVTKRGLFWNEVLKVKSYQPNLLMQKLNIGTVIVEPQVTIGENVVVNDVTYADDLANYLDKILFTYKNSPADISEIKPFIAKPRGKRSP